MFVKPTREGLLVKCPISKQAVPPEGREVPENAYWLRRLREGSLERVEPPATPAEPKGSGRAPRGRGKTQTGAED